MREKPISKPITAKTIDKKFKVLKVLQWIYESYEFINPAIKRPIPPEIAELCIIEK